LLVGTLWLVFSLGGAGFSAFVLDPTQKEEIFLTAAQSLFAVAVIANLTITRAEALGMMALFFGQFLLPVPAVRIGFAIAYVVLAVGIFTVSSSARVNLWDSIVHVFRPSRVRR